MSSTLEPTLHASIDASDSISAWFDEIIAILRKDELLLTTGAASPETQKMYNTFITGDIADILAMSRKNSSKYFYGNILLKYVQEIGARKAAPIMLAFDYSDSKILVWAEVPNEENDATIDKMLLAEAKVNSEYSKYGFHVSSMFVEASDKMPKPTHYRELKLSGN